MLPIRGKVRARVYVPEFDAVGLAIDQTLNIRMDSDVDREFTATVTSVSPVAISRYRNDPQKYIVIEAELERVDPDLMLVGSNLSATITTSVIEDAFLVPQQAVFYEQDKPFVYVLNGSSPEPREVQLGRRSPTLVEITHGLVPGEQVSVVAPDGGTG
jgi:multidrug efflux pump subunit AcrA (membrane-fusion protein)